MAKLNKTYNILIRVVILILTFYYLYDQLIYHHNLTELSQSLLDMAGKSNFWFLTALVLLLLPLNLLLNSYVWKLLVDKLEVVSMGNALKAVLAGISVSMFMPNRTGDFLGRILILKKANRIQAILVTLIGSVAQLMTIIIFGIISVVLFFPHWLPLVNSLNTWIYIGVIITALLSLLLGIFSYLNFSVFTDIIKRISGKAHRKIVKYVTVFSFYNARELSYVLLLSMVRYLIFSLQFYLLLRLFGIPLNYYNAMVLIGMIYLLMTVIPTIALSELGVRGSVSLYIFQLYYGMAVSQYSTYIVMASSVLWIINLALPALVGIIFIFSLKFFRKK